MKEIDIFSASQLATSIPGGGALSMVEEGSSSSSSAVQLGSSPAIDRYNPIILDPKRLAHTTALSPPTPLQNEITKSASSYFASKPNNKINNKKKVKPAKPIKDEKRKSSFGADSEINTGSSSIIGARRSWSCMKPGEFVSPPGSTRYLLGEKAFLNVLSDFDPVLKLLPPEPSKTKVVRKVEPAAAPAPPSSARAADQVVVLKVSLHCRGCERKMRKHISRMEGVSSFDIDFTAKRVTVVGNVTPLGVLASISKVKNAQLWASPISAVSQSNPGTPFAVK